MKQTDLESLSFTAKKNEPVNEMHILLLAAKEIIGTMEILNEIDDCGAKDFIKMVKKASKRCPQTGLLSRTKLEGIRQVNTESVQNYNM